MEEMPRESGFGGGQVNGRLGEMEGSSPGFDSGTTSRATNPYDGDGPVAAEKAQNQAKHARFDDGLAG